VVDICRETDAAPPAARYSYELGDPLALKIEKVAKLYYGADRVDFSPRAEKDLVRIAAQGGGELPVCIAKTQLSLSDDPTKPGRPRGFALQVREVRLSAGAGFAVALTGEMMTMPGLPKEPAAWNIHVDASGRIRGLMQND